MERHLQRAHAQQYEEYLSESAAIRARRKRPASATESEFISVKLKKSDVEESLVELVTKNGRPFTAINDSGLQNLILKPISRQYPDMKFDTDRVKSKVEEKYEQDVKAVIKANLARRLVSVKVDCATCAYRSFIGLNAQIIYAGQIHVYTLDIIELHSSHTGQHLKVKM